MLKTFKSLPKDPIELRAVSELMAAEIKSQAYRIEKLEKELAAHRKARFGSKSESLDQLAFDLQEDAEIEAAAKSQKTALEGDADEDAPTKGFVRLLCCDVIKIRVSFRLPFLRHSCSTG